MLDEALLELKQFCNTNSIAKDYVVDKPEGKSFTQTLHTLTKQLFATRKWQYAILQDKGSKSNTTNNQANSLKKHQSFDDKIEELKRLADTVCRHFKSKTPSRLGIFNDTTGKRAVDNTAKLNQKTKVDTTPRSSVSITGLHL